MKNKIYIEVDTDKEPPITFGKPSDIEPPTDFEGGKTMLLNDITCVCESLCTLIHVADQNKYENKDVLIAAVISRLNDMFSVE